MANDVAPASARPFSRTGELHAAGEWPIGDRAASATPHTLPVNLSAQDWKAARARRYLHHHPHGEDFQRAYTSLMHKLAYRYPQTGLPSAREGRGGSGWRHLKEVVGCGPGRLMWMDGVVTLYDQTAVPISTQKPVPGRILHGGRSGTMTTVREDYNYGVPDRGITRFEIKPWYTNNMPQPLPAICVDKAAPAPGKYKGFYSMQQQYPV